MGVRCWLHAALEAVKHNKQNKMASTTTTMAANQAVFIALPSASNSESKKEHIAKVFPKKVMLICGILQLSCAASVAIIQMILLGISSRHHAEVGHGLWCGLFFGIAGGVGLIAAHRPSYCMVIAFMVLSIIAALFSLPLVVLAGISVGEAKRRQRYSSRYDDPNVAIMVFGSIQLLCGLAQAVISITTSAFSCRTVCCGKRTRAGTVIFNPEHATGRARAGEFTAIPLNAIAMPPAVATASAAQPDDNPPNYDDVTTEKNAESQQPGNAATYQRFE